MASIIERKGAKGTTYQVKVRKQGRTVTKTFTRKTDAKEWARQIETKISNQQLPRPEALKKTLAELIDRCINEELGELKTADDRIGHLNWWKRELGGLKLAEVTPEAIKVGMGKLKDGRSPSTCNRYLGSLSTALSTAVREYEWLDTNPVSRVRKLKEPRGRVRFLSDDERSRLLKSCRESRSPVLYPVVILALSTGMRKGEILGLSWDAVNLKQGRITLHDTKNGERRAVPITGAALAILKEHAKVRRIDTKLVFPDRAGEAPAKFRDSWLEALKRAGIEDFKFHDLRHTAASYLAMSGATLAEIAEILGHKTLAMVKRYSHLSTDHVAGVIGKLDERMFGSMEGYKNEKI